MVFTLDSRSAPGKLRAMEYFRNALLDKVMSRKQWTVIEFSEFSESEKSLNHELGSI